LPRTLLLSRQQPDAARSRNSSKSTLAHDAVAAAVPHKHHSIIMIRVCGAVCALVQASFSLSMGRTRSLATELTHHNSILAIFRVLFRFKARSDELRKISLTSQVCAWKMKKIRLSTDTI